MHKYIQKIIIKRQVVRRYVRIIAFGILGMLIGGYVVNGYLFTSTQVASESQQIVQINRTESVFERSAPVRLSIPKIDVDAKFVSPLGLNNDKTVEVPDDFDRVGWYKYGATPGEIGSSVILGHVDSLEGPAVFYSLGQLNEEDEIYVERVDGTTATFIVTEIEKVSQDDFPSQKVYQNVGYAGLRLVTCTGTYDRGKLKYTHNLIVYAELKADEYVQE